MIRMKMFLTLIFVLTCLAGSAKAAPTMASPPGQDFILCYSNTIQGETEPCG